MRIHKTICCISLHFSMFIIHISSGNLHGEESVLHAPRVIVPEDIHRKRFHERVPSLTTYDILTQYYSFVCQDKTPGYYGDPHYDCRIFHVCQPDGRRDTFFCPAWTRFNNNIQICDWQHKVDDQCISLYALQQATSPANDKRYLLPGIIHSHSPPRAVSLVDIAPPQEKYHNPNQKPNQKQYEQQEYYQSVYDQQEPRLKFLVEEQFALYKARRNFMLNPHSQPQPVFTITIQEPHPDLPHRASATIHDLSQPTLLVAEMPPLAAPETNEPAAYSQKSQYGSDNLTGGEPDGGVDNYRSNSQSAVDSGNESARREDLTGVTRAPETGISYTTKVDYADKHSQIDHSHQPDGYDAGPVIELWIPTKVRKIIQQ